jgi:preprotein translocase subunit SecB
MSVKVELDTLAETLADYTFAYLITVGEDHRTHVMAEVPVLRDGVFELASVGNSTRRNVHAFDTVTLVWPPRRPDGLTLIIDGRGEVGDGLRVIPLRAVPHRAATPQ